VAQSKPAILPEPHGQMVLFVQVVKNAWHFQPVNSCINVIVHQEQHNVQGILPRAAIRPELDGRMEQLAQVTKPALPLREQFARQISLPAKTNVPVRVYSVEPRLDVLTMLGTVIPPVQPHHTFARIIQLQLIAVAQLAQSAQLFQPEGQVVNSQLVKAAVQVKAYSVEPFSGCTNDTGTLIPAGSTSPYFCQQIQLQPTAFAQLAQSAQLFNRRGKLPSGNTCTPSTGACQQIDANHCGNVGRQPQPAD